jgi:subtilisin-like proprotein convertase family protein
MASPRSTHIFALWLALLGLPAGSASGGQGPVPEIEPNATPAEATSLGSGPSLVALGNVFPNADVDFYSFTAGAGDRVYAAVMTSFSASATTPSGTDSLVDVIDTDGATPLEEDDDDGVFGSLASSIAGVTIPSDGTYFVRVKHFSSSTTLRPYHLHLEVRDGTPETETEPNDTGPGQALPASSWVAGSTSSPADVDLYSVSLEAGDTVFLSLDLDPERDGVEWDGEVGLGPFGGTFLMANDPGGSAPDSEAFFMTVTEGGMYSVRVSAAGTTFGSYHLSVTVHPATPASGNCTTYTSADVPQAIPTGPGEASSTLVVPGHPRIADVDVAIALTHAFMPDLDVHLVSPAGNDDGLFADVGAAGQNQMDLVLDDEAGIPIGSFSMVRGMAYQPEPNYRLGWFDGEDAGGTWTLVIHDDVAQDGGSLDGWSLTVCEPPPICPAGLDPVPLFSTDFESDDGGFTHSGTADEWQRGLPSSGAITTCNGGTSCWKTDLDGTYEASSTQDLVSPVIDLPGGSAPLRVRWAERYQMESATFDHAFVEIREQGGANPRRLFEWLDATMTDGVGGGSTTIDESAGWGVVTAEIDDYVGASVELRFHLDSDDSVELAGLAIDDVAIVACQSESEPTPTPTLTAAPTPTATASLTPIASPTPTATAFTAPTATETPPAGPIATATPTQSSPQSTATAAPGGSVVLERRGEASGGPGDVLGSGTFDLVNATGDTRVSSVTIAASEPSLLSEMRLECDAGGERRSVTVTPAGETNDFSFAPPFVIPAGGVAACHLDVKLAGALAAGGRLLFASVAGGPPSLAAAFVLLVITVSSRRRRALVAVAIVGGLLSSASCGGDDGRGLPTTQTLTTVSASTAAEPVGYAGLPAELGTARLIANGD